jgi:hypothetical protein
MRAIVAAQTRPVHRWRQENRLNQSAAGSDFNLDAAEPDSEFFVSDEPWDRGSD